jgi:hypothetical protein
MSDTGHDILTHSRMACHKACPRRDQYQYVLGIRRDREGQPLRMGSAVHLGLDLLGQGKGLHQACDAVHWNYSEIPAWCQTPEEREAWDVEHEVVIRLLCGYEWRWRESGIQVVASEQKFDLPLINPETGYASTRWRLAGKIDSIVELADGRLAVMEHKTTSDSIAPESDYWLPLRMDQQISLYMLAARALGYEVCTVLYDVIHKPDIAPLLIPELDESGLKIVVDAEGQRVLKANGEPRQSADAAKGWRLKARRQTADEFGERLNEDIAARPDVYYARQEIPRIDSDLKEFASEVWQIQHAIAYAERNGHWFRNTAACLKPYRCEYVGICSNNIDPSVALPEGFVKLDYVHPELREE